MKYILASLFLLICSIIFGQELSVNTYNFDGSYNLPRKKIDCIVGDQQGFTWLGTNEGLYRFDGNQSVRYNNLPPAIRNASIKALKIDNINRLWIGTYSEGLVMLDLTNGEYQVFNISTFEHDNLPHNRIKTINIDAKQRIWVGTQISGIQMLREDLSGFDHYLPSKTYKEKASREIDDVVSSFYELNHPDVIWIGTLSGVLRFDMLKKSFDLFDFIEENQFGSKNFSTMENVARQVIVRGDSIYAGTWGGGLCIMDRKTKKWRSHKFHQVPPVSRSRNVVNIFSYHFDPEKLIVVDLSGGSYLYNLVNNQFEVISDEQYIRSTVQGDRQWLVSRYQGLQVMEMKNQALYVDKLPYNVNAFYHDIQRKKYVIALQSDLSIYELNYNGDIVNKVDFLPSTREGYAFIAGTFTPYKNGFLYRVNKAVLYYDTLAQQITVLDFFKKSAIDMPGIMAHTTVGDTLWVGGKGLGLYRYHLGALQVEKFHSANGGTHDDWIYDIYSDRDGNVWYGTDRGFGVYLARRDTFVGYTRLKAQRDNNVLHGIEITGFSQDKEGNVYVGGHKGQILKVTKQGIDNGSLKSELIKQENDKGQVYISLINDGAGKLWVNSYSTIFSYEIETGEINEFVLPDRMLNSWGVYSLGDGRVGIALASGFAICQPNPSYTKSSDFQLIYTGLSIKGNEAYSGYQLKDMENINLSYDQNYITVQTSLLGITDPDYIEFQYRMKGLRDEWVTSPTGNNIHWTNLGEGDYELGVRAMVEGNWIRSQPIKIQIAPPFYRTIWFQLLGFLLIASLIYGFYRYRIRQTKMQAKHDIELADMEMKTLRSQMNPHFIFNCLNSIKLAIFEGEIDKAGKYNTRFSKLLRMILHHAKSHYVTLEEELKAMMLYIELEKMRFEDKFDYKIDVDPDLQPSQIDIPPMILQPFIENAIWHGLMPKKEQGLVFIQVKPYGSEIQCIIEDNGVGRQVATDQNRGRKRHQSLGIQITQERLDILNETYKMNASMEIMDLFSDGISTGTRVVINLPRHHNLEAR